MSAEDLPERPDVDDLVPERKHVDGPERSVMEELLRPEEVERLQDGPGRWLLPGTPP